MGPLAATDLSPNEILSTKSASAHLVSCSELEAGNSAAVLVRSSMEPSGVRLSPEQPGVVFLNS